MFEAALVDTEIGEVTSLARGEAIGRSVHLETEPEPAVDRARAGAQRDPDDGSAAPGVAHPVCARSGGPVALAGTLKMGKAIGSAIVRLPNLATSIVAPFSGRRVYPRQAGAPRGGQRQSEQSVEDGLDWLVRHQREDGSWSLNFQDRCQGTPARQPR